MRAAGLAAEGERRRQPESCLADGDGVPTGDAVPIAFPQEEAFGGAWMRRSWIPGAGEAQA